jgi:hypothetical protein
MLLHYSSFHDDARCSPYTGVRRLARGFRPRRKPRKAILWLG